MSAAPSFVSRRDAEEAEAAEMFRLTTAFSASSAPLRETPSAPDGAGWPA